MSTILFFHPCKPITRHHAASRVAPASILATAFAWSNGESFPQLGNLLTYFASAFHGLNNITKLERRKAKWV